MGHVSESTSLDNEEKFTQILDILWGRLDVMIHDVKIHFLPTKLSGLW